MRVMSPNLSWPNRISSYQPNLPRSSLNAHSSEFRPSSSSSSSSTHSNTPSNITSQNLTTSPTTSSISIKESPVERSRRFLLDGRTKELQSNKKYKSLAFNASGKRVVAAGSGPGEKSGSETCVQLWATDVWKVEQEFKTHPDNIDQLVWDPTNDDIFATASTDKNVRIWDLRTKDGVINVKIDKVATPHSNINIAFSPDGKYIACGVREDSLTFLDPRVPDVLATKPFHAEVNELTWNPAGDLLFVTTGHGTVEVLKWYWDKLDAVPLTTIHAHTASIFCIKFDPTGRIFAVGSADSLASIWDSNEYTCLKTVGNHFYPIRSLSFSYDSSLLALASEDPVIEIYHVESGTQVGSISTDISLNSIAWAPKQMVLAYCGTDYIKPTYEDGEKKEGYKHDKSNNIKIFSVSERIV